MLAKLTRAYAAQLEWQQENKLRTCLLEKGRVFHGEHMTRGFFKAPEQGRGTLGLMGYTCPCDLASWIAVIQVSQE